MFSAGEIERLPEENDLLSHPLKVKEK